MERTTVISGLLLVLAVCITHAQWEPYVEGPYTTVRFFLNRSTTEVQLPTYQDVWAPKEAGQYPIVYFMDGYGGAVPGEFYEDIFNRLSSFGVVIVLPWKTVQGGLSVDEKIPFIQSIIDWNEEYLQQILFEEGADEGATILTDMAVGLGHSAGAHLICSYLRETCGPFKALAYLSPVDGADPWGIQDDFCTHHNETLNYEIPTLILSAGLDSVASFGPIACAPDELSNMRYYEAAGESAAKWMVNATDFGHVDFMDPFFVQLAGSSHFCATNTDASFLEFTTYRHYVAGQLASFIKGLEADDCFPYFEYLQNLDLLPVDVTGTYELPGSDCPKPYCSWTPTDA